MFSYTFKDGATVSVPELELSSKEMRKLRSLSELDIAYNLLESKLSEEELALVESYEVVPVDDPEAEAAEPVSVDREFTEVMGFFNEWFAGAVSGK